MAEGWTGTVLPGGGSDADGHACQNRPDFRAGPIKTSIHCPARPRRGRPPKLRRQRRRPAVSGDQRGRRLRLASADDRAQLAVESQEVKNETTPGNLLTTRLIGSMIQDWRE